MTSISLTVVILTYNEEMHLERAIASVRPFATKIIVVDSYSTDGTVQVAERCGARVLFRRFDNQARQFNWALDNASICSDWIMRLDADEVIEPDLANEIAQKLPLLEADVVGVTLKRKHIFLGRWIRHGGRYPLLMLRIWRNGSGRVEDRWMDEHVVVSGGGIVTFEGGFADHNLNDIGYFIDKHNKYATREAIEIVAQRRKLNIRNVDGKNYDMSKQAAIKRALKDNFYNAVPFQLSALLYFIFRYIIQLGFLDGTPGMIYHFLQGYWYRFLVGAKVYEYERAINFCAGDVVQELSRVTGHNLDVAR